jgi:hypothetical protein
MVQVSPLGLGHGILLWKHAVHGRRLMRAEAVAEVSSHAYCCALAAMIPVHLSAESHHLTIPPLKYADLGQRPLFLTWSMAS